MLVYVQVTRRKIYDFSGSICDPLCKPYAFLISKQVPHYFKKAQEYIFRNLLDFLRIPGLRKFMFNIMNFYVTKNKKSILYLSVCKISYIPVEFSG